MMIHRYVVLGLVLAACGGDRGGAPRAEEAVAVAGIASDSASPVDVVDVGPLADEPVEAEAFTSSDGDDASPPSTDDTQSAAPASVATPEPAVTPATADAAAILERAERTYSELRSLQADFVQEVHVPLLDATRQSRGRIYHRRPDLFAMRFTDPEGDLLIADGSDVWMYNPSTDPRQVMRSRLADGGQQVDLQREFLSNATERYSVTLEGTEMVGGRNAYALTLVPRGPSPYRRIRLWVDTEDALVRRFEIIEENESERRLQMSNLRPNVEIPEEIFEFTPPPGTQVFSP